MTYVYNSVSSLLVVFIYRENLSILYCPGTFLDEAVYFLNDTSCIICRYLTAEVVEPLLLVTWGYHKMNTLVYLIVPYNKGIPMIESFFRIHLSCHLHHFIVSYCIAKQCLASSSYCVSV